MDYLPRWKPVFVLEYSPDLLSEEDRLHLIARLENVLAVLKALPSTAAPSPAPSRAPTDQ